MTGKEIADLVVTASIGLAWPLVVCVILVVLRQPIIDLLGKMESAKAPGIEATFFREAMADPATSEEAKDRLANVWKGISQAKGQSVPVEAQVQLEVSAAKRGRPASEEVRKVLAEQDYVETVKQAILRIGVQASQLQTHGGNPIGWHDPERNWRAASFVLRPVHGVGDLQVHAEAQPSPATIHGIEIDAKWARDNNTPYKLCLVSRQGLHIEGVITCLWESPDDDNKLAASLEKLGVFDYVDDPQDS